MTMQLCLQDHLHWVTLCAPQLCRCMIATKIHSFGISVSIPPGEANGILANFSVCLSRQQYSGGGASVKVLMS